MSADAVRALAKRFFDSIEAGDIEAVRGIYAPEAVIWHNTDRLGSSVSENVEVLTGFVARIPTRRYEDRRLTAWDSGFVQQHVLKGVRADGAEVTLPACIVCAVRDGRITRLDEYFDSAQVAAFRSA